MSKVISPRKSVRPPSLPEAEPSLAAPSRPSRRWRLLAGIALVLAAAGVGFWLWSVSRRSTVAPVASPAYALRPLEAKLLAAAAREPKAPAPYQQLAEEYAASDRLASALWAYQEALARAPGSADLRAKTAAALLRMGYLETAESMLRAVVSTGGAPAATARPQLADLLLSTGRPAAVLPLLKAAGPEAEVPRGRALEAMGDLAAARQAYRRAGDAGDAEGFERLARLELAAGNVPAARAALRALGGQRSPRPEDLLLIANAHAAGGTPQALDQALARLLRCAQLQPTNVEAYYQAGLIFARKGDRAAALAQFERAVKLDPEHAAARERLAGLLQAAGQQARAHRERAAYYTLAAQPDRSLAELRRARAAGFSDDLERSLMATRTASELQQVAGAVREAQEGLKRHPGNPELMLQLGLLYQIGGSRQALERLCEEWRARQPASGVPDWLLGRQAVADTRTEDAIRWFEAACAKEPERADFAVALGVAYFMVPTPENTARARHWLEKAVALNERSAPAHQHLGRVLLQAGELEPARRQLLQSLDIQPAQPELLNHLVQVFTRQGQPQVAGLYADLARAEEKRHRERQRLRRAVRDRPSDAAARIAFARFLLRQGQLDAARHQLQRAAETAPAARPLLADVNRLLRVQS